MASGNPTCFASLQACLLRISKLDAAGSPLTGAANGYLSDALVFVQVSVEVEEGAEFTQKNGCGAVAQYFKDTDHIKRLSLTMNLCQLDAYLISQLTDAPLFSTGGLAIGWQYPAVNAAASNGVCMEVWTKAWNSTSQAVPAATSPDPAYWHWVFPKTTWTLGNIAMEDSIMIIPVTGIGTENAQITADGPYNDWPPGVPTAGGVTHVGGVFLDDNFPATFCAPIAVTSAS